MIQYLVNNAYINKKQTYQIGSMMLCLIWNLSISIKIIN